MNQSSPTHSVDCVARTQQSSQQQKDERQARANIGSGTNSPPLEATGSARPMGVADIDGKYNAGHVSDREQRKEYFDHAEKAQGAKRQERFVGQSMADEMDGRT